MKRLTVFFLFLYAGLFASVEEKWVEVEGAQIFCKVLGKGSPILIIHGGPGMMHNYLLQGISSLAENHQLIFYDQRGCGRSTGEVNEDTMQMDRFVEDLEMLRKAFDLEKITLLAHSWGGLLAMKYAMVHPDSIDRLILMNTLPASFEDCFFTVTEGMERLAPYQAELEQIAQSPEFLSGNHEAIERYYKLRGRANFYDPEKADLLEVTFEIKDFRVVSKMGELFFQNMVVEDFNWYEDLKKIHLPVLIIHSDFDFIPMSDAEKVHQSIPHSKYVILSECGHCPFIEKPDELLRHLREFL